MEIKPLLAISLVLAAAQLCLAQQASTVPEAVLERITDDDPLSLPKYLTEEERRHPLPTPSLEDLLKAAPPTGAVYTPPEYGHNEGLLIRWGYYNDVLTPMAVGITTGDPDATVYILVTGASQQSSATSTLTSAGADLSQVEFIIYSSDTVWIRDYGPRFIFEDDLRAIVNHTYNRPRPNDNAFPAHLGSLWDEPVYDLLLTLGGGNFHLFGTGDAFMSDLILTENPGLSEQDVKDYYFDYQNLDVTIYDGFPTSFDSTQHIDMWMLPVAADEIIIGEYAPSTGMPYQITEGAVTDLTGSGYTVYRTPGWNSGGTHYTYTNAVIFNDLLFVPEFGGSYASQDAQAKGVFETAFPAHQIIQVDCSNIIHAAGALHCIVMHVPGYLSLIPAVRVQSPDGDEYWTVGQTHHITWSAHDNSGITGMDIYYSTDGGATFPHVIATGEPNDGFFSWTVPDTPSNQCRVKVVAHDGDGNSGEDVSNADFVIASSAEQLVYDFPLDTDPGWVTEGQWSFGQPIGGGGEQGYPDPTSGYTGLNVYGYNLAGDYGNGIPEYSLTTAPLDCSSLADVRLSFRRWLGVGQPPHDHAAVKVSTDGTNWTTVWQNSGSITDSSWVLHEIDISDVADGEPAVRLRWTMGPTDPDWRFCGWNIDDIEVWAFLILTDCNENGIADSEDISVGASQDCNGNNIPDECDIADGTTDDLDENGIPDECECSSPAAPEPGAVAVETNRSLLVRGAELTGITALRVTFVDLPPPFDVYNGLSMWVGEPQEVCENSGVVDPDLAPEWPTFMAGALQCDPYFADWSGYDSVSVYHEAIVPAGTFEVQAIGEGCSPAYEPNFSTALVSTTCIWGDIVENCATTPCGPPDGSVDVTTDVTAALDKFKNLPGAPDKSRCDQDPARLDMLISIVDVTWALEAFKALPYPFEPGLPPPPCP